MPYEPKWENIEASAGFVFGLAIAVLLLIPTVLALAKCIG